MRTLKLIPVFLFFVLTSCSPVSVYSDYDKNVDFKTYKTYAFYMPGIDKVEISDLDKRRILRAIEDQMQAKGFIKSENPDLLVNIFTKSGGHVEVYQFSGEWGLSSDPVGNLYMAPFFTYIPDTFYIDFIDAKKKELIWLGKGTGALAGNVYKKDEKVAEFVNQILTQYPPKNY